MSDSISDSGCVASESAVVGAGSHPGVLSPRDVFEGWLFGLPQAEFLAIAGAANAIRAVLRKHPGAVIPREVLEGWFGS